MFGLPKNDVETLLDEIIDTLKEYFGDKITSSFTINEMTDTPYLMFNFSFIMYDFFNVVFNYDRGYFGCYIVVGDKKIPIRSSQEWFEQADMKVFCKELEEQLELRIPDKFLEYHGWK